LRWICFGCFLNLATKREAARIYCTATYAAKAGHAMQLLSPQAPPVVHLISGQKSRHQGGLAGRRMTQNANNRLIGAFNHGWAVA